MLLCILKHLRATLVGSTVVNNNQLEVLKVLIQHRINRSFNKSELGVVNGHKDRYLDFLQHKGNAIFFPIAKKRENFRIAVK
jgi:hypothetical protein